MKWICLTFLKNWKNQHMQEKQIQLNTVKKSFVLNVNSDSKVKLDDGLFRWMEETNSEREEVTEVETG